MARYVHQEIGQEITCLAGHYAVIEEGRLNLDGREIIYIVGSATIESSCCGSGSFGYIRVPGYILSWKSQRDESGLEVSLVDPIEDEAIQHKIRDLLKGKYPHFQTVDFT